MGVKDSKLAGGNLNSFEKFSGQKPGGVYMTPQPKSAGKGGSDVRDEVLKSKPSEDSLSWPINIPTKDK